MARFWNPHGGEPVNDAESEVVRALVDGLPDDHTVIPWITIPHNWKRDEIDAIVVTPHVVVVVEIKGIGKPVRIREQFYEVGGERRDHPVNVTEVKAKRLKDKVVRALPDLRRKLWVHHLVVFAWQPPIFHVDESMKRWVCLVDPAIGRISDPEVLAGAGDQRVDLPVEQVLNAIGVGAEARRKQETFGNYRTTALLGEDPSGRLYEAEHLISEKPVRLRLHLVDRFLPRAERNAVVRRALQAFRALTELEARVGHVPQVVGPIDAYEQDDGHIVTISPADPAPALADLDELGETLSPEARLGVIRGMARAMQAAHVAQLTHRRLSPDVVHVDGGVDDPTEVVARVGGWDRARVEDSPSGRGASLGSLVVGGEASVAPELASGDIRSWQAVDLWNLGSLTRWVWDRLGGADETMPDRLAEVVGILTSLDPDDREGSSAMELGQVAADLLDDLLPSGDPPLPAVGLDLRPGGHIGERYAVAAVLGAGATGTVVAVDDLRAGLRVAIKVFAEGLADEAAINEFQQLLQVQHPHVVRVLDLFWVEGRACLKMKLLSGSSLRDLLLAEGPVSRARIDEWLDGLLAALATLHRAGVVHRDLTPENLVVEEGGPVIVDFGLASSGEDVMVGGSGRYRPALAAVDTMDPTVDLFALAVIVHEALTGVHPFGDEKACRGEPTIDPSIEGRLAAVLARAMAPDAEDRFGSADEFRDALQEPEAVVEPEEPQTDPDPGPDPEVSDDIETRGSWLGPKVTLEVLPGTEERHQMQTPGGESDQRVEVTSAVLRSGPDIRLDIEYCMAENGERWVHAVDAHSSPACVHRLVHGLRPGIHGVPGRDTVRYMELRQAWIDDDPDWPRVRKVPMDDLDAGAATGVEALLVGLGAEVVAAREEAWGDDGRRRGQLCMVFDAENVVVAMAAYALTRLAPIVNVVRDRGEPVRPSPEKVDPLPADPVVWPSLDARLSEGRGGFGDRYLERHGYWVCHTGKGWRRPRAPFATLRGALFAKDGARAICAGEGRVDQRTATWGPARLVVVRIDDAAILTDGTEVAVIPWKRVPPKDMDAAIRGFEGATERRPLDESSFG